MSESSDEMKARAIAEKYFPQAIEATVRWELMEDIENALKEKGASERQKQRERSAKAIEAIDPLDIVCDWENNDAIAFALQKAFAKAMREQEDL